MIQRRFNMGVFEAIPERNAWHALGSPRETIARPKMSQIEWETNEIGTWQSWPTSRLPRLHAGSFFGEMALLEKNVRMASIAALTFCDLFVLSAADFEDISQTNGALREALNAFVRKRRDSNADNRAGKG